MLATRSSRLRSCVRRGAAGVTILIGLSLVAAGPAAAQAQLVPISGAGSTWSQIAIDQWKGNVTQYGLRVNYAGTGSTDGRNQFAGGQVDYAVSEVPYGLVDGGVREPTPARKFAYMPVVAGGTSFMYNLRVAGKRVANLRLSGDVIAKIFTSNITQWNDPAILADNPGLALPARKIVPVVRADGSGTSAQFTQWLATEHRGVWDPYCAKAGQATPCGQTSFFPVVPGTGMTAQSQSSGVSNYVSLDQNEGTINYVEYAYALDAGFPVAKVLNRAGFFVEPTEYSVAVALQEAKINGDETSPAYLTQELSGVYAGADPRVYPLSSYSYMIIPTALENGFTEDKGYTLGKFAYYFLCEGQRQAPALGYSPLPRNLVVAGLEQVAKIKGVDAQDVDISKCNNPTFSADGSNKLAVEAPQPKDCDKLGTTQCTSGTGGARATETEVSSQGEDGGGQDIQAPVAAEAPAAADPAAPAQADAAAPAAADPAAPAASSGPQQLAGTVSGAAPTAVTKGGKVVAVPAPVIGAPKVDATGKVVVDAKGKPVLVTAADVAAAAAFSGANNVARGPNDSNNNAAPGTPGAKGAVGTPKGTASTLPGGKTVAGASVGLLKKVVDPDTGEEIITGGEQGAAPGVVDSSNGGAADSGGGTSSGRTISAVPVSMTATSSDAFRLTLMIFAALLLMAVVTVPPVVARRLKDRSSL